MPANPTTDHSRTVQRVAATLQANQAIAICPGIQPGKVRLAPVDHERAGESGDFDAEAVARVLVEGRSLAKFYEKHF